MSRLMSMAQNVKCLPKSERKSNKISRLNNRKVSEERRMTKNFLLALPTVLLLASAGTVSAAGFQLSEQNASGLGTAYAGSAAVADNASTLFANPAGMANLKGVNVSAGLAGIKTRIRFRGAAGASGGDAGGWEAVPNAYLSWPLTPQLSAGLGISAPFGLATEYRAAWLGQDEGIKSELRTLNFNPSLAYKLNDKVALGLGLNYQKADGELTQAGGRLKGDDGAYGWNVGALFTLSPAMRLGVAYRSGIEHSLRGHGNGGQPIRTDLDLPATFTLSVWQQVSERWEAMGDLSYTRWNSLDQLVIIDRNTGLPLGEPEVFNYDNSWRIAWGAAYQFSDTSKLKFGVAYDRTPVNSRDRSVRVPDNNRLWLSLGGQWKLGRASVIDLGYSYLYLKDANIAQGKAVGKYHNSAHIVGVQYSVGY